MQRLLRSAVLFASFLLATEAFATTYYVDCAAGSDASSGTSQSSPWLHQPYMQGWSGTYTHTAGDQFIFKGGVTCPKSYFSLVPAHGGASGNPDYYGVDKTWYTGSAWTRPIWDLGGTSEIDSTNAVVNLETHQPSNITFDNFEIKGFYWSGSYQYHANSIFLAAVNITNIVIENIYLHGWAHGGTSDGMTLVKGYNQGNANAGSVLSNCTIDGSDGDSVSGEAVYNWPLVHDCVIRDMSNGIVGTNEILYNNIIYNIHQSFDSADHENTIETWLPLNDSVQTQYIYNNVIHDCDAAVQPLYVNPGGANNNGRTAYVYNNLVYNCVWGPPLLQDSECLGSVSCQPSQETLYYYNNTVVAPQSNNACMRVVNRGNGNIGTMVFENNHCISQVGIFGYDSGISINNLTQTTNTLMNSSTANSQGYTAGNSYRPTSSTGATVGAGTNLASLCTGSLSELCNDVSGVLGLTTTGTGVPRPATGAWDTGAFEQSGGTGNAAPAAPTGLKVVSVQ